MVATAKTEVSWSTPTDTLWGSTMLHLPLTSND
jgi:hypothetical protein